MTMTEQVLARHAGRKTVAPGDNIWVDVDILMTHDVCGPGTIGIFRKQFGPHAKVWDPEKVVIIPDHYIFTNDQHAHHNIDVLRAFVKEQGLPYYYDVGTDKYKGVCHIALPEEGHTRPGEVLFGTDSHTCTAGESVAKSASDGPGGTRLHSTHRYRPYALLGLSRKEIGRHTSEVQSRLQLVCR